MDSPQELAEKENLEFIRNIIKGFKIYLYKLYVDILDQERHTASYSVIQPHVASRVLYRPGGGKMGRWCILLNLDVVVISYSYSF